MKRNLGLLLILIIIMNIFMCTIPNIVEAEEIFHATSDMLIGKSYAVLTETGELIFFRSEATYEHQSTGTFTDIKGNTYRGVVYCGYHSIDEGTHNDGFENLSGTSYYPFPYDMRKKVLSVRVAEGQAIRPWRYLFGNTYTGLMAHMFYGFSNCTSIDLTGFDTEHVDFWNECFYGCTSLVNLEMRGIDFTNAYSITKMFLGCESLTSLDFHDDTFSKVKYASGLFSGCSSLENISFASENVFASNEKFDSMFYDCYSLKQLDLSSFDTSKATTMDSMFGYCHNLEELDLSNFNTANVTTMRTMFERCSNLKSLNVSSFDTNNVTNMQSMFSMCESLPKLDISNFRAPKVQNTESMFKGCASLTELDLSNFNTSTQLKNASFMFGSTTVGGYNGQPNKYLKCAIKHLDISGMTLSGLSQGTYSLWDTYNPAVVESIVMGENSTPKTKYMVFPKPPASKDGVNYTGKWIRDDKSYGPYTPDELVENYDGNTMTGTWVWEIASYTVSYSYKGIVPNEASELPENASYEQGATVIVENKATAPGYTFSGWSRTGTFEMPAEDVEITGSFTANTDTPYIVEHYLEDLTENSYTLAKTDNLTGTTDTEVEATAKEYEGFTFDNTIEGTKTSGTIAGDGGLVLKLYYKRNSYNVTYAYTGDVPDGASELPQSETYKYGEEIKVPENATAEGYTFSGWIKDYINMPAQDIEITGYFIEEPRLYKIEYYFDNELDEALVEILNAEKNEEINLTPQTPVKHGAKNYTLVSNNHNIVVSVNDEDNIIRVYYETDVLDYAIDNFEDTTEGDGIPDKYQIRITYKVENGSWNDGTQGTKTDIITLKDKDGNPAEDGTGEINVPQVGNKPAEGYTNGSWNANISNKVSKRDDGKEYVYSYKTISKADISEAKGKLSNPKTDDIMHNYLLIGTAGVLVLMIVRKIRRKYSRKARDIQF